MKRSVRLAITVVHVKIWGRAFRTYSYQLAGVLGLQHRTQIVEQRPHRAPSDPFSDDRSEDLTSIQ